MNLSNSYSSKLLLFAVSIMMLATGWLDSTEQMGSFEIVNGQERHEHLLQSNAGHHIFGKTYDNYVWIRLAETPEKDGSISDHLDIDLWNYDGPGTYLPADPKSNKRDGKRWNVWWHQAGKVFVNQPEAKDCVLKVTEENGLLSGQFGCQNLILQNGDERIHVNNGKFQVKLKDGNAK